MTLDPEDDGSVMTVSLEDNGCIVMLDPEDNSSVMTAIWLCRHTSESRT
jgi:hypothetical protein